MAFAPYTYRIKSVERVLDGDTFDALLSLGFHARLLIRIRLADIDTWELKPIQDDPRGHLARTATAQWLMCATRPLATTTQPTTRTPTPDGGFGRWAARIHDEATGDSLSAYLRSQGHEKAASHPR
jgi:micrococcal nuclease